MERELPMLTICGSNFRVDVVKEELIELNNPNNTIAFYEMMENEDGYVLCYDTQTRSAFRGEREEYERRQGDMKHLQLSPMHTLDPEGYAQVIARMEAIREDYFRTAPLPDAVRQMMLEMDEITIGGKAYTIDMWGDQLIEEGSGNAIYFSDMIPHGQQLLFWYDPVTGRAFEGSHAERNQRKDLVRVDVPVTRIMVPAYTVNRAAQEHSRKMKR